MTRCKRTGSLRPSAVVLVAAWFVVSAAAVSGDASAATGAQQDFSEPSLALLRDALTAYEAVRSDLAGDKLAVLPASASALGGKLRLSIEEPDGIEGPAQSVVLEAALAAESLAQAKDLEAARVTFGDVSRLVMTLADRDPRLVEGWHVFACPMVESFAKWMQPTEALENPYMGPAMPKCGFASDWSLPKPAKAKLAAKTEASDGSRPEPVFKPGIPGLKMVDVRDHKFLWREIDELQIWERGERITVREFRSKAIEKTAHFLELESTDADEFIATAAEAVDQVRESFANRVVVGETSGVEGQFSSDLRAAEARLTSLLQDAPRHHLFAPGTKKWLLKLAFGPKESTEAEQAKGAGHA